MDTRGLHAGAAQKCTPCVSAAGLTTAGQQKRNRSDDLDADTGCIIARKFPKVLNVWTLAQPRIDRHNRLGQRELAMEKSFVTESFPFRLLSTVLCTVFVVDAYTTCISIPSASQLTRCRSRSSKMRKMAFTMMHDILDAIEKGDRDADDLFDACVQQ